MGNKGFDSGTSAHNLKSGSRKLRTNTKIRRDKIVRFRSVSNSFHGHHFYVKKPRGHSYPCPSVFLVCMDGYVLPSMDTLLSTHARRSEQGLQAQLACISYQRGVVIVVEVNVSCWKSTHHI